MEQHQECNHAVDCENVFTPLPFIEDHASALDFSAPSVTGVVQAPAPSDATLADTAVEAFSALIGISAGMLGGGLLSIPAATVGAWVARETAQALQDLLDPEAQARSLFTALITGKDADANREINEGFSSLITGAAIGMTGVASMAVKTLPGWTSYAQATGAMAGQATSYLANGLRTLYTLSTDNDGMTEADWQAMTIYAWEGALQTLISGGVFGHLNGRLAGINKGISGFGTDCAVAAVGHLTAEGLHAFVYQKDWTVDQDTIGRTLVNMVPGAVIYATTRLQLPYRKNVGIVLMNEQGEIFLGYRDEKVGKKYPWTLPQGGVEGQEPPQKVAVRELFEETAIPPEDVRVLAVTRGSVKYQWEEPKIRGGILYAGQDQKFVALRYLGDGDISLRLAAEPEFLEYKWVPADEVLGNIPARKRPGAEYALRQFRGIIEDQVMTYHNQVNAEVLV